MLSRRIMCLCSLVVALACLGTASCNDPPIPTPAPFPTALPTPTPSAMDAFDGAVFGISLGGSLIATEEFSVDEADGKLLVFSELRRVDGSGIIERRTVVLSASLGPLRYDMERIERGVRSVWVGERRSGGMDSLNNNQAWYGPVVFESTSPAPDIMLESVPSALPYALLALKYTGPREEGDQDETLDLHCLDVIEDHPLSRPLTLAPAADRTGAIIGTVALQGSIEGGPNPVFTMWIRPKGRALFGAEVEDYRHNLWAAVDAPQLRGADKLVIQRISKLPEPPESPTPEPGGVELAIAGADGTLLVGTLALPSGDGPWPCVVVHSADRAVPRVWAGDAFTEHGWASFAYDKRGVGASEGDFQRGALSNLAQDAVAVATALAARDDIDAERIHFWGFGEGGQVGAAALSLGDSYAGAVLGSCISKGSIVPNLAEHRVNSVLAQAYGWDGLLVASYTEASVRQWERWLFEGEERVSALGRRISIRPLKELADADIADMLSQAQAPVLVLHGELDRWTPVQEARGVAQALSAGGADIELQVFAGLGADLGGEASDGLVAPQVWTAILEWLDAH